MWYITHRTGPRRRGFQMSTEATLASVIAIVREFAPGPIAPRAVHFQHRALAAPEDYRSYFDAPVTFEAEMDALLFSAASLDRRNRLGDEGVARYLVSQLDAEMAALAAPETLDEAVRRAVQDALSDGVPKAATVARRLGLSERTLQRRLGAEGLSFRDLVDAARRDLACGLLEHSDYALADVAFLTGFSEQSAFSRAFKRWSAETPTAFRAARQQSHA